ncbi:DUF4224 domain-containing protein [Dechloromonas denitrificans]|uniref:DUF4224 domain-containing protein n=1 Tax=Dechloromonas denitrificans TaxID=281362 RepID=UPI001CF8E342|nr:DUF4224 domain-containing protein [Dechloromonas denitrificans]UCV01733.1 DUF4224 domain-containing protein [Dechloromonas denitrificans]
MFLTKEEVRELTGYVRSADQCRWLEKRGWKFERNAITGRPVVLRKHVEEMLSLDVPNRDTAPPEPKLNMNWGKK